MPLMTVVGAGSVYLQVSAPDRAAGRLHAGQRAVVTLDTAPGRPLTGIVGEKLPPAAGERGVPVRIRLSGAGVPLQASAGARATITLPAPSARPMVPLSAVRSEGGERYVFVVEDGFARRRRIEIGASAGDRVEVAAGLRSGEAVIVAGPLAVKDGAPVRAGSSP
jgi:RND family efflux transporter MFP subunit